MPINYGFNIHKRLLALPFFVIDEAVEMIKSGEIASYYYDVDHACLKK